MTDFDEMDPDHVCEEYEVPVQKWSIFYLGSVLCAFMQNIFNAWSQLFDDFRIDFLAHGQWKTNKKHEDAEVKKFRQQINAMDAM